MSPKDVIIITNPKDRRAIKKVTKKYFGVDIEIRIQAKPNGVASAIKLVKDIKVPVIVHLGDFYSPELGKFLKWASRIKNGVVINRVRNPEWYGILDLNSRKIIEKPKTFISNWAVRGLYCYQPEAFLHLQGLTLSPRGEYEITDFNNRLKLHFFVMKRVFDLGSRQGILSLKKHLK